MPERNSLDHTQNSNMTDYDGRSHDTHSDSKSQHDSCECYDVVSQSSLAGGSVFVGRLPYILTKADVKQFMEFWGPIRDIVLVKDKETENSCAICVYRNVSAADTACMFNGLKMGAFLHGVKYGETTLTVQRLRSSL